MLFVPARRRSRRLQSAIRAERAESERSNQTRHRLGHEMPSPFSMVRSSGRLSPTTLW
jgi:hypothetical protein